MHSPLPHLNGVRMARDPRRVGGNQCGIFRRGDRRIRADAGAGVEERDRLHAEPAHERYPAQEVRAHRVVQRQVGELPRRELVDVVAAEHPRAAEQVQGLERRALTDEPTGEARLDPDPLRDSESGIVRGRVGKTRLAEILITRAQEALEDRYLQQSVFDTLMRIGRTVERRSSQLRLRTFGMPESAVGEALAGLEAEDLKPGREDPARHGKQAGVRGDPEPQVGDPGRHRCPASGP